MRSVRRGSFWLLGLGGEKGEHIVSERSHYAVSHGICDIVPGLQSLPKFIGIVFRPRYLFGDPIVELFVLRLGVPHTPLILGAVAIGLPCGIGRLDGVEDATSAVIFPLVLLLFSREDKQRAQAPRQFQRRVSQVTHGGTPSVRPRAL